jgi:hypothetical protein
MGYRAATDPVGGTERVEHILNGTNRLPASDSGSLVPTGFSGNSGLNTHVSVYYSKLVMSRQTTDPPDPTEGESSATCGTRAWRAC